MQVEGSVRLQPPLWLIADYADPDRPRPVVMNEATTVWFTSREDANAFCVKTSGLPEKAQPLFLLDWEAVMPALEFITQEHVYFMLVDPNDSSERRTLIDDVIRQVKAKTLDGRNAAIEFNSRAIYDIDVYCDEAGVAPVKDGDGPFIVSTLAVPRANITGLPETAYGPKATASYLKAVHAVHNSYMIKPRAGYGTALDKKVTIYRKVSEHNAKVNRPGIWFTSADQISHNNLVWVFAMQQVVGWTLAEAARRKYVFLENVRVFLNAYTHTKAMNRYFRDMIASHVPKVAAAVCARKADDKLIPESQRKAAVRWADKFRIKSVSVQFDNETPFLGNRALVRLADRLSHFTRKHVLPGKKKGGLFAAMKELELQPELPFDITELVTKVDQKILNNWEAESGVKVTE